MRDDLADMTLRRLAARAAASFRARTSYWTGGWRDRQLASVAERANVNIVILNLGPPLRLGEQPTVGPQELTGFSMPLMKVFDEAEIQRAAGIKLRHVVAKGTSWGVKITLHNVDARELDPRSDPNVLKLDLLEPPIAGPYSPEQADRLPRVIAELSGVTWLGVQAEVLAERAIFDTIGRTASDEALRYWRHYSDALNEDVASAMVSYDASLRERYLSLARRVRHVAPAEAAEYAKAAADLLFPDVIVTSAPTYTLAAELETYDDNLLISDTTGNLINRAAAAASLRQEFSELRGNWPKLRALVGAHIARLNNQADEGLAVWRDFMVSVLVRQEAIRPLVAADIRTPADVIGDYENASQDSDYVIGFRNAATVALVGSPWLLSSAHLAIAVLRAPIELLRARLPTGAFLQIQQDSPFAANERLHRLAQLGLAEELEERAWLQLVHSTLGATTPSIKTTVESVLAEREGGIK